jgi:preprotein translocase subunit SecD
MLDFPKWKYALVFIVLLFSVLYFTPNLFPHDAAVQISANRGGVIDAALDTRIKELLKTHHITAKSVAIEKNALMIRLHNSDEQIKVADLVRPELGSGYTVALNLANTVPEWLSKVGAKPMTLGLDLQGGVHFLMQVDQKTALDKRENAYVDEIRGVLRDKDFSSYDVTRSVEGIRLSFDKASDKIRAQNILGVEFSKLMFVELPDSNDLGLLAKVSAAELKAISDGAIEQNVTTLRNRINALGVAEPIIQRQGASRIVVQLPGLQDTTAAKNTLGATATLEYRAQIGDDRQAQDALQSGIVPPEARLYYWRQVDPSLPRRAILLSRRVIVSGDQLVDATPGLDSQSGSPMVSIKLNSAGGKRMFNHTLENVGKPMAIVYIERRPMTRIIDGKEVRSAEIIEEVISSARINGVFGKDFQTTGLDPKEAEQLAKQLKAGALAAPVDIVEERVIGPSLGQKNIEAGKQAIMYGFLMVCVLMIVYYKLAGLIAVVSLFFNLLLLSALLSVLGATMTMPGIAGIVLTLGMAIDGNVLIIERIREELRAGNSPLASIKAGYERAWTVILDSNVAKIIAGISLFSFGSGPVRGFAVVLIFGVMTSMFTSVTVSRALTTLIYGHGRKVTKVSV